MARENAGLPQPLRATASVLGRVPGAGAVGHAAEGALNAVGTVSPRGRRMAAYAGAGILGAAGVVEWPVALTGAAVVWLTQQKPGARSEKTGKATSGAAGSPSRAKSATIAAGRPKGTAGTPTRTASHPGHGRAHHSRTTEGD
ncbi:hypothetical protein ACIQ6Y_18060 [Streptomyces sp. NPDC096205]|uniref:hypothetical protein n=1 Tax=Streptomyces sp. NPDC096205 TaxID=3366081 RepID=UPI00382846F5